MTFATFAAWPVMPWNIKKKAYPIIFAGQRQFPGTLLNSKVVGPAFLCQCSFQGLFPFCKKYIAAVRTHTFSDLVIAQDGESPKKVSSQRAS